MQPDFTDLISCVFFFGDNVNGGDSVFFYGKSSKFIGDMVHVVKFKHGQAICGDFSKIIHGANNWRGERQVISFYANKKCLHCVRTMCKYVISCCSFLVIKSMFFVNQNCSWKIYSKYALSCVFFLPNYKPYHSCLSKK